MEWEKSFWRSFRCFVVVGVALLVVGCNVMAQSEEDDRNLPYPTYNTVPKTSFSCSDKIPGYYADTETRCQAWHWCLPTGQMVSFLCPNGTLFDQRYRVCNWFYNMQCDEAPSHYSINNDLYKDVEGNYIKG